MSMFSIHSIFRPETGNRSLKLHGIGPPTVACLDRRESKNLFTLDWKHPKLEIVCFMSRADLEATGERIRATLEEAEREERLDETQNERDEMDEAANEQETCDEEDH